MNTKSNTIRKPWGYEQIIEHNNKYMVKKLFMKKDNRCSLQYHNYKIETIYILEGRLKIYFGSINNLKYKVFNKDNFITLDKKVVHRMAALTNCYYLESSTPHLKDVIRISDDYNRK